MFAGSATTRHGLRNHTAILRIKHLPHSWRTHDQRSAILPIVQEPVGMPHDASISLSFFPHAGVTTAILRKVRQFVLQFTCFGDQSAVFVSPIRLDYWRSAALRWNIIITGHFAFHGRLHRIIRLVVTIITVSNARKIKAHSSDHCRNRKTLHASRFPRIRFSISGIQYGMFWMTFIGTIFFDGV